MVRAIMHGCNGKMGQVITGLVKNDAEIEFVAGIDGYMGIANTYPVFESIEKCDVEADVIIDFSNAKAVDNLLDYCVENDFKGLLHQDITLTYNAAMLESHKEDLMKIEGIKKIEEVNTYPIKIKTDHIEDSLINLIDEDSLLNTE